MPVDAIDELDPRDYDAAGLGIGHGSGDSVVERLAETIDTVNELCEESDKAITDPGAAGAIPVTKSGTCPLVTEAAEARSLAIPSFLGQEIVLVLDTDGGDCTVTSSQAVNAAGNTVLTFNDAGDFVVLKAVTIGGALRWRIAENVGVTLS